jgi:hypothetical protein
MLAVRPLFYASYRDVYDALNSSRQRVSTEFLLDFLRARGIILSPQTSRTDLVEAVASYAYESADLDEICDQLEVHSRGDRVTHTSLSASVNADDVRLALDTIKQARTGYNEVLDFKREDGRIEITVQYYEIDEGRTLLRQSRPKEAKIEFMSTGDGMRVRYPGAERVGDIADALVQEISKAAPNLALSNIDLSSLNKLQRTKFFQLLIQNLDGFRTVDVNKVNVDRDAGAPAFAPDIEDDGADDLDPDDSAKDEVSEEVKYVLKRCSLSGSGILHARELRRFLESDFFISRIVWEAQPRSRKSTLPKAEFEALLEHPAEGLGFKYTIRGVYSRKRNKKDFASTKRRPNDLEREGLLDLVELAAQQSYAEVLAETGGEPE